MEIVLNLVWVVVALASIAIWKYRWLPSRLHSRNSALPELVALVCALALLFPSISLTDDLHPEIVAVDASSGKRNGCQILVPASQRGRATSNVAVHAAAMHAPGAPTESIVTSRLVVVFSRISYPAIVCSSQHGRSPPDSLV
jgi:hypothetical protein